MTSNHQGVILVNTSLMAVGSNVTDYVYFQGGKAALVIAATQQAGVINFVMGRVGKENHTIKINSGAWNGNEARLAYCPAGMYRIEAATGSTIGLFAGIFPAP